ncbi:MAG: histidinol-phosphatase HisJ family protein [Lachnospiraceae bacterium]|nr:histidinol-phosphatase HisJ family protein [Lachnospiraceae bacterium]
MLWDTHMHTQFSTDGSAAPAAMAEKALELKLEGICFTDHLDYDYPLQEPDGEPEFLLDIEGYRHSIEAVQKDYSGKLPVYMGIELGLQPHLAKRHYELLQSCSFDFVIGSSHVVHGQDPYYASYYENRTEEEAYREYFVSILENIDAFDGFDVYGHIDYVVRYGPNRNRDYTYAGYADIIDEILKRLIAKGKGIEINTAGFKYGLGHPNPTEEILKRYRALGGEIITIGSDAHAPEQIAYDFIKVPDILKEAGFRYYTVFRQRIPQFIPL